MNHVRIEDVPNAVQPAAVMRQLTDSLGATDVAINYYELAPGDSFAFAYHAHEVQEELFVVVEGTATWKTEAGERTVAAGEAIRFGTDEFQRGWNRGDDRLRAFAIGAPLAYGEQPKTAECPDCGDRQPVSIRRPPGDTGRPTGTGPSAVITVCDTCTTEVGRWFRTPDGENTRFDPPD